MLEMFLFNDMLYFVVQMLALLLHNRGGSGFESRSRFYVYQLS
jgi:hypothetical protein